MKHSYRILANLLSLLVLLMPSYQVFADEAREIDALFRDYSGTQSPGASVIVIKGGQIVFKRLGWNVMETIEYDSVRVAVMVRQLVK